MPATDSASSSPAHHTSFGRSILSLRHRDQIHTASPDRSTTTSHPDEVDAFQRHAADLLLDLLPDTTTQAPELLSLDWTRHLLSSFLITLEDFRTLLLSSTLARPPLDRLLADFLDRAVKALDLCNALRDGLDTLRHCRKHLAIAATALSSPSTTPTTDAQIRRARKALTDLTILLMLDDSSSTTPHRGNRSFGTTFTRNPIPPKPGHGHHRRTSSGSGSGSSGSSSHFRSLSWSVSKSWSASRQLQAIGGNLPVPRPNDVAATNGLASAVYTMGAVLFVTSWALVAAIPCQDRGLQAHFAVPKSFPWAGPVTALYDRVLEESKKKERKHSCGLLREIHLIERCSRQLMEVTDDAVEFPLDEGKEAEVREAARELVLVCDTLKDGLDPMERQVREMFHRIVRTRTEILDVLSRPSTNNTTAE